MLCELSISKKIRALGMWHGSCGPQGCSLTLERVVFMKGVMKKGEYDLNSAITFLMVGLGIGSILALVCNPKQREEINSWRMSEFRPRREAEERAA
jgi:hypothetical protein